MHLLISFDFFLGVKNGNSEEKEIVDIKELKLKKKEVEKAAGVDSSNAASGNNNTASAQTSENNSGSNSKEGGGPIVVQIKISLWNIGGEVINKLLYPLYLSLDCLYLITFNIKNLNFPQLEYWCYYLKTLLSKCKGNLHAILVATHSDEFSPEDEVEINNKMEIIKEKFSHYTFSFIIDFIVVSSKTYFNIPLLKYKIFSVITTYPPPPHPPHIPSSVLNFHKSLQKDLKNRLFFFLFFIFYFLFFYFFIFFSLHACFFFISILFKISLFQSMKIISVIFRFAISLS